MESEAARARRREYSREYNRKYQQENREKRAEQKKRYRALYPEKIREMKRAQRAARPELKRASDMRRYTKQRAAFAANCAKYRAAKLRATPPWLTEEQLRKIEAWYDLAQACPGYQVDHIVPLKGKTVCGLHVPWNLRLLTLSENSSKGNRSWPGCVTNAIPMPT